MPAPPSRLYSTAPNRTTIAAAGTSTVAIPNGATRYTIGVDPNATWTGPLQVAERLTAAGVTQVNRAYGLNNTTSIQPTNGTGWQDCPAGPADILLTNSDAAIAVQFSVRWEFDLTSVR